MARRKRRPRYSEDAVSGAIRHLLAPSALGWYSTEAGAMGHWSPSAGRFIERAGGTRTTAGVPDLICLMTDPLPFVLFAEAKGAATSVKEAQWTFAARCALIGQPALIVRTPDAMLSGLKLLGLLPERLRTQGRVFWGQWDAEETPENINFLSTMRERFWTNLGRADSLNALPPIVENARRKAPPWPLGYDWR